jgi:hypothetical protein
MKSVTRRTLLKYIGHIGLTLAFSKLAFAWYAQGYSHSLDNGLRNIFHNKKSAKIIGRRYLAMVPEEANLKRLRALIYRTSGYENFLLYYNKDNKLRDFLAAKQQDDFRNDHTVILDGWLLSETEARLCALVALS